MASKVIENHGTVIEMLQIVQVHVHEDMCAFYIQYINKYILKFVYKSMYYNIWGSIHVYIYTYTGCTTTVIVYKKQCNIYIYYACMSIICRFNK